MFEKSKSILSSLTADELTELLVSLGAELIEKKEYILKTNSKMFGDNNCDSSKKCKYNKFERDNYHNTEFSPAA